MPRLPVRARQRAWATSVGSGRRLRASARDVGNGCRRWQGNACELGDGMKSYDLWIDGAWSKSLASAVMDIENPATGAVIASVPDANAGDVDRAVQAAHEAFVDGRWSRLTPGQRSDAILRFAAALEARMEEFARVESENTGKPYAAVSLGGDLPFAVDNLRFFAAAARGTHGMAA